MYKVFVVGSQYDYPKWIKKYSLVSKLEDADIVFFTGGEDVSPSIYGHEQNKKTYCSIERDKAEIKIYNEANKLKKFCIGVCRGSQFLNVMNGGILYQDVNNHTRPHTIYTEDGQEYDMTSTHHQMLILPYRNGRLIAWANKLSDYYMIGKRFVPVKEIKSIKEPEIVYFEQSGSLAIQGHPEYGVSERTVNYLNNLLDKLYSEYQDYIKGIEKNKNFKNYWSTSYKYKTAEVPLEDLNDIAERLDRQIEELRDNNIEEPVDFNDE